MLISSGMKDDLRLISFEDHTETFFHADISNDRNKIKTGIILLKFQTDIMQRWLGGIKHDQLLDVHLSQLPAKFATNTTGSSCHQHNLATELSHHLLHIDMNFWTTQQVFNLDRAYPLVETSVFVSLTDTRSNQRFQSTPFTILKQAVFLFTGILVTGKQDAADTFLMNKLVEAIFILKWINGKISHASDGVACSVDTEAYHLIVGAVH